MALFVLTGALSLTAGMGMGALIPVKPKKVHKPNPPVLYKNVPLKGGAKPNATPTAAGLDFTEFDENLIQMLQEKPTVPVQPVRSAVPVQPVHPAVPVRTIRPSVAMSPEYYTPPSNMPSNPPQVTLTGGAKTAPKNRYQVNTSWF